MEKSGKHKSYFREGAATITEACIVILFHNKSVIEICYHSHTAEFNWLPPDTRRMVSAKVLQYLL